MQQTVTLAWRMNYQKKQEVEDQSKESNFQASQERQEEETPKLSLGNALPLWSNQ